MKKFLVKIESYELLKFTLYGWEINVTSNWYWIFPTTKTV